MLVNKVVKFQNPNKSIRKLDDQSDANLPEDQDKLFKLLSQQILQDKVDELDLFIQN